MRLLARHTMLVALLLLTTSEALIVQWGLLASGRGVLGPLGFLALLPTVAALNFALIFWLRPRSRSGFSAMLMNRFIMLGSMGALLSGPLLFASFAVVIVPLFALYGSADPGPVARGVILAGGGVAIAFGFGSILWGFAVGQRRVTVERIDVPMRDLPPEHTGVRIVQITDLHFGPQLRAAKLARFVQRVNELDGDLIVITGDIFDFDPIYIDEGCKALADLRARHGVYAVLGNHDVWTGADAVAEGIARHTKIQLLRDAWERIDVRGRPLYVVGIDDPGRGWNERRMESPALERLAAEVPTDGPRILLMHRPSFFPQVARLGMPLALAGHTHGGQIALPLAHHYNISRLLTDWSRGYFEDGESVMYVNRGLGVAGPPVRLNCSREICVLQLIPR
jgi:hypothetical protein